MVSASNVSKELKTMKTIIEKIVDAMFELISGSFDIDLRDLKYEDLFAGDDRMAEAAA